ncbi:putative serine/threonine protein kinase [Aspergillus ibericus CBS 121593]|uniref:Putative serine/threonine protein kinase n=1 Tax=Aspergillus ibericus CBS 121593 TaxID=1448316 RepID=A0A395GI30_9EURO|nr:putative serine/threonine protein kinase [Aspergillus ibericus CBS 121593]RAK95070.1 putative serine/threonine protein kinase [Aspergillus ibericus CBS 121593]
MSLLQLGQTLRGRLGKYTITKQIQDTVWFARNQANETVVVKGVQGHPRVENERDALKRFQHSTTHLRPLLDEVQEPAEPPIIILKYLEDNLLSSSIKKTLNRQELKYVARSILKALKVLHKDKYVHTDVKPDNIFVNYKQGKNRFSEIQLGDLGGCYPADSSIARRGTPVGAAIWSSPEILMETPWNTATDIWSFGTVLISLIYGGDFNLFRPRTVPYGHEEYNLEVLKQQFRYFGPFPGKYQEIAGPETVLAILYLMHEIPQSQTTPFIRTTEREVSLRDKLFIGKIMMLDWRDRPTARELLEDRWFEQD